MFKELEVLELDIKMKIIQTKKITFKTLIKDLHWILIAHLRIIILKMHKYNHQKFVSHTEEQISITILIIAIIIQLKHHYKIIKLKH